MAARLVSAVLAMSSACVLSACSGEQEELTVWMEQQKREVKPNALHDRCALERARRPDGSLNRNQGRWALHSSTSCSMECRR